MKLKDLLRYLLLIEVNKDFNSIPVIKINQNFDLLKLNRKEIIWKSLDY